MPRTPSVKAVRTITVSFGTELFTALEEFQRREGISNPTEAIRIALWRFWVKEGLVKN